MRFPSIAARNLGDRIVDVEMHAGDVVVDYAFMGTDRTRPLTAGSWMRCNIIPTFIVGWQPERLQDELAFGVT
jgi:hypothetical protein